MAPRALNGSREDGIDHGETGSAASRCQDEHRSSSTEESPLPGSPAAEQQTEKISQGAMNPPPNGGLVAWLQVLCSFFLFWNTWGVLNTFGVYQTYYESGDLWSETSSNISWIGSIQSATVLMVGAFTGPIYDRGYLRTLLVIGCFMICFGHMMLSLTTTFWQSLLAQGFVIGIGGGCLFIPAIAILPTYFTSHLGLAIGLAASGSAVGGIVYPIMFYNCLNAVGFPWAVRILGFTTLTTLILPITVMRMRLIPKASRKVIDWAAFTDWPYMTFTVGCILGFIGCYSGFFYTSYYAQAQGLTSETLSFYLVPILNGASLFGRTVPAWASDFFGPLNVIIPGALVVGIVLICYLPVSTVGAMIVVTIIFGFFSGVFIALPPVLFFGLTADKTKTGTRMGMGFTLISLGVLAGGPGSGAILGTNPDDSSWVGVWVYAGLMPLAAAAIFTALRFWRSGGKLIAKV